MGTWICTVLGSPMLPPMDRVGAAELHGRRRGTGEMRNCTPCSS
jgi:hypothetical protein